MIESIRGRASRRLVVGTLFIVGSLTGCGSFGSFSLSTRGRTAGASSEREAKPASAERTEAEGRSDTETKKSAKPDKSAESSILSQAVTARFSDVSMADSAVFSKMSAALERIDAKMIVKLKSSTGLYPAPTDLDDDGWQRPGGLKRCEKGFLASQGLSLVEDRVSGGTRLRIDNCERTAYAQGYEHLEPGTLGVVWGKTEKGRVVFVTLDGGRYVTSERELEPANVDAASLGASPKLDHAIVIPQARLFGASDPDVAAYAKKQDETAEKFFQCSKKLWEAAEAKYEANNAITVYAARERANDQVTDRTWKQQEAQCDKFKKSYEAGLEDFGKKRVAERTKLYEKVAAKLRG